MLKKVLVYALSHDARARDKVLFVYKSNVLTLPQGDIVKERPDWSALDVLEDSTGLGIYPDRRDPPGSIVFRDNDFYRFPILMGKIVVKDGEILCYSIEVNEIRPVEGDAIWMPWHMARNDSRLSDMTRFVTSLLYAGIQGWELRMDDHGNWFVPYFSGVSHDNPFVSDLLNRKETIDLYDNADEIINKSVDRHFNKKPTKKKSWLGWFKFW